MFPKYSPILRLHRTRWLIVLALVFMMACQPPTKPKPRITQTKEEVLRSREQLLSGNVEKKWWRTVPESELEQRQSIQDSNDVRYIFYRNYNVTTFGSYGSRQGHWSIDDDTDLSFHFEGPDSVKRFEIIQLDTNALQLRDDAGTIYSYKPE